MNSGTSLPEWADDKETELREIEWDWRLLDEQENREGHILSPGWLDLAKRAKEVEAGRIRAELAVANFVTESGPKLIVASEGMAPFGDDQTDSAATHESELQWGSPTSTIDPVTQEVSVEIEATRVLHDQDQTRHRFRFQVAGDQVNAWRSLPKAS